MSETVKTAKIAKMYTVLDHPVLDAVAEFSEEEFKKQFPDLYITMRESNLTSLTQTRTYNSEGDSAVIKVCISNIVLPTCQRCGAVAIVSVNGKTSDRCLMSHLHREYDGYVLRDMGVGADDYLEFAFCVECGQIQGQFPRRIHGRIVTRETEGYPYDKEVKG